MAGRQRWSALAILAWVGLAGWGWFHLRPAQLGGPVTYSIVSGSSMQPALHAGDLVVIRPTSRYEVGDVVAYRTRSGASILHRITGQQGDAYVLQGDHNPWVDPYRPTHADIMGRAEHRVPKVGWIIEWLRRPLATALTVGLVSFLVGWRHQRHAEKTTAPGGAVAALTLVVMAVAWQPAPADAARSTVPRTKLRVTSRSITPNDLKPSACSAIAVQHLVTGSGTVQGSTDKDLILAGPGSDTLKGVGEKDCLVGGGGNDTLNGGADDDACLGGPGTDSFVNCEKAIQ